MAQEEMEDQKLRCARSKGAFSPSAVQLAPGRSLVFETVALIQLPNLRFGDSHGSIGQVCARPAAFQRLRPLNRIFKTVCSWHGHVGDRGCLIMEAVVGLPMVQESCF